MIAWSFGKTTGSWPLGTWVGTGLGLVALHIVILGLSPYFGYGCRPDPEHYFLLVGTQVLAGAVYLLAVCRCRGSGESSLLLWILLVGLILRGLMLFSTPILEDDFYRYLWDGGVVAQGYNPYTLAPEAVVELPRGGNPVPEALRQLAASSGPVISRINHPHLTTIYPPLAQGAFALAHWLAPWSLTTWRLVLLVADVASLSLLAVILRTLHLPLAWLAMYWWNPLLVKEVLNAGHLDVLMLPFVLGSVWLTLRGWTVAALLSLAGAVGIKIWPLILLPLLARPLFADLRRLGLGLGVFLLALGVIFWPLSTVGWQENSGLLAYGSRWEMNDSLFRLITWGAAAVLRVVGLEPDGGPRLARYVVLALLSAILLWLIRRPWRYGLDLCQRCLWTLAALFLFSPTQFPWYYVGLIPFLAIRPRLSLLLLTALLPIYYLRYFFLAQGQGWIFDNSIVWLQFLPVWILLGWEWWSNRSIVEEN